MERIWKTAPNDTFFPQRKGHLWVNTKKYWLVRGLVRVARWFVFKPKNPNLGKFWRVLQWKILVYFVTNRSILRPLEIFYGHLVYFVVIWYIFPRFGIFVPRKIWQPGTFSGEPFKSFTGVVFVVASL
jgi:hypothetical protein